MASFIHVQCFQDGTFSTCKRSIIWEVFGPKAHSCPEGWTLIYGDDGGGTLYLNDDEDVTGFSILRAGDVAFDDLYSLAKEIPSLIYWPDACAVADARYLAGIPQWLLDAFKKPAAIVHNKDELLFQLSQPSGR
jgi:hypothetical protein